MKIQLNVNDKKAENGTGDVKSSADSGGVGKGSEFVLPKNNQANSTNFSTTTWSQNYHTHKYCGSILILFVIPI